MSSNKPVTDASACPCGSKLAYSDCCNRYLEKGGIAESAEQLMRSRYCAFVACNESYLLETWHPNTRPSRVRLDEKQRWLGLSIRATSAGGRDGESGTVEFVARFKVDGKGHRLHEISRFEKIDGRWYYLDGEHL
jgi:SEC-C motif domain protein